MAAGHAESVACLVREAGTSCGACERFQPRLIPGERSGFIQGIPDRQMQGLAYNADCRKVGMPLELSVLPLGRGRSISTDIADLVKIIDASGLDYRL